MNGSTFDFNESTVRADVCLNNESWGLAITAITGSCILLGNLLVVTVILRFPSRRFRALNWLILQLAVADFLVGAVVMWIGTFSTLLLDRVTLMTSIFTYGALASFTSTSTLGVFFVAADRYFFILRHHDYKRIVTKRRLAAAIGVAFALPFSVFVIAPAAGWNCVANCDCRVYNRDANALYCVGAHCSHMMTPFTIETILVGGVCLLATLVVSIFIYLHIFLKVYLRRSEARDNAATRRNRRMKRTEVRMMKTMIMVLGGFVVTTGPLAVCCVVSYFYNDRDLHFVQRILVVVSTINSVCNPFFYFWRIPEMSEKLKRMARACATTFCYCFCAYDDDTAGGRRRLSSIRWRLNTHKNAGGGATTDESSQHSEHTVGRQVRYNADPRMSKTTLV